MDLLELETEALKLPFDERARLAETLLESLDALSEDEHRRLWAEEAVRRDAELDADPSRGRPAAEVFRSTRAHARLSASLRAALPCIVR
ncbi:MAG: addiction module protein [Byssovorax sp.]